MTPGHAGKKKRPEQGPSYATIRWEGMSIPPRFPVALEPLSAPLARGEQNETEKKRVFRRRFVLVRSVTGS